MGPNTSFLTVPLIIDKIKNLRDYQLSRNLPSFARNFEEKKMPWKHVPHALIIKRSVCDEKSGGGGGFFFCFKIILYVYWMSWFTDQYRGK